MNNSLTQYTWDDIDIIDDVGKSIFPPRNDFTIKKADDEKRLVFGWALVSATSDGEKIIDHQGDIVEQDELESGAYEYVLNFRDAGEEHNARLRKKARMVESVVFTSEKLQAMGIPEGTVPYGWWIGFYVDDDKTWELIKNGTYKMFSIEGRAIREPITKDITKALRNYDEFPEYMMWLEENLDATIDEQKEAKVYYDSKKKVAKTFGELVEKFNPYHDAKGRFTFANSATSFTYSPGKSKAHDNAIAREKERHAAAMAEEAKKPGNRKLNLNQDAIRRADDNSLMGSAGTVLAREAQSRIENYKKRNAIQDDWTDEQKAYAKQREDDYTKLVEDYYNDQISRRANNVSWAVAGPANFNQRRYEKQDQAMRNKASDYEEKLKNFEHNTKQRLASMEPEDKQIARWRNGKWSHGETISADDPLATKKLQAKLDYHKEQQQKMKDANAYYRKNGTMVGFSGFSESTNRNIDSHINSDMWRMEKKPFQSYQLTNNNASIKSTESRLNQMLKQKATASSGGGGNTSFKGGELIRNTDMNRLQMKFDGVPDAATRQKLKSSGWRWSPSQGVWQRQLTSNAEYSAKQITDELNKSYDGAKTFSELIMS